MGYLVVDMVAIGTILLQVVLVVLEKLSEHLLQKPFSGLDADLHRVNKYTRESDGRTIRRRRERNELRKSIPLLE